MYQILLGALLLLGGSCYYLFDQNQTLIGNNAKLEVAVEEQKQAIESIRESYEKQGEALNNMSRANAAIQAEKDSYLEIFKRHNLNLLAIKKPGMIETRINNGTKKVFEGLENDSKNITVTATADDDS
jgi:hypothetical protein|tara:strand:+ start:15 stop:398 length:384 start_codon:yes stop_codon:yes gene_type:complete